MIDIREHGGPFKGAVDKKAIELVFSHLNGDNSLEMVSTSTLKGFIIVFFQMSGNLFYSTVKDGKVYTAMTSMPGNILYISGCHPVTTPVESIVVIGMNTTVDSQRNINLALFGINETTGALTVLSTQNVATQVTYVIYTIHAPLVIGDMVYTLVFDNNAGTLYPRIVKCKINANNTITFVSSVRSVSPMYFSGYSANDTEMVEMTDGVNVAVGMFGINTPYAFKFNKSTLAMTTLQIVSNNVVSGANFDYGRFSTVIEDGNGFFSFKTISVNTVAINHTDFTGTIVKSVTITKDNIPGLPATIYGLAAINFIFTSEGAILKVVGGRIYLSCQVLPSSQSMRKVQLIISVDIATFTDFKMESMADVSLSTKPVMFGYRAQDPKHIYGLLTTTNNPAYLNIYRKKI